MVYLLVMFGVMTDFNAFSLAACPLNPRQDSKSPAPCAKKSFFLRSFFVDTCRPGGKPPFFSPAPRIPGKKTVNVPYTAQKNYSARCGIEPLFGRLKQWTPLRRLRIRGKESVHFSIYMIFAMHNVMQAARILEFGPRKNETASFLNRFVQFLAAFGGKYGFCHFCKACFLRISGFFDIITELSFQAGAMLAVLPPPRMIHVKFLFLHLTLEAACCILF